MEGRAGWLAAGLASAVWMVGAAAPAGAQAAGPVARAEGRASSPLRKVVVASVLTRFTGGLDERLATAARLADRAAAEAARTAGGRGLDLLVFPESAIQRPGRTAAEQAVPLEGAVLTTLGSKAREHRTWLVVPMTLSEGGAAGPISNAAVLLDRAGRVAGIYRKVRPMIDESGVAEGGVRPGSQYPVFDADFGRLGILICWDQNYEEAWDALAAARAEIVALPSASPQTIRPAAQAMRHALYVMTSTPRDNASLVDPIGRVSARITTPGVLVREIDLAFAILHWSERLRDGRALAERFGTKAGFSYSSREDTGVFWSNDPHRSIGSMIRELGLRQMVDEIERVRHGTARK
ncbi:MAG TPA: carbon-nitrogen hydrolase family protein [Vicinamibacterales bacterium]|nr:carbon-nitrogen hydrolase family protein [Vicinamibacterales bacterium]HOQ61692.1 carbon-nitrogen hydrolase family protein [Vicinamibacterales bacterium]HPK70880.1 carbon-nitrogen hydrolase family protein [Vicinamibacterales bacterium]